VCNKVWTLVLSVASPVVLAVSLLVVPSQSVAAVPVAGSVSGTSISWRSDLSGGIAIVEVLGPNGFYIRELVEASYYGSLSLDPHGPLVDGSYRYQVTVRKPGRQGETEQELASSTGRVSGGFTVVGGSVVTNSGDGESGGAQ